ncbi:LLM class flavin-dependent oxidoreductase [Streptomyces sp. NPDC048254]|uniref:LLM class flavin-dependent oxidoreductase n=1 Tax=Streptomyces sp. NPDC048254 TaxID=3365525 RepID=UPI003723DEB6
MSTPTITSLAFLTPGNFADDDPYPGLEETLQLFEYGERLGYDGAWIRQRHLEHGVGSAAVFLAAAGQRTERIELGTAVIPIGYESPFRLAEDLALADVLSRGRLQIGFSTGMPHADLLGDLVYDGDWRGFDLPAGVRAPMVAVPLATYTGWNTRAPGQGHGALHEFSGSTFPFAATEDERLITGDPRPSVQKRHQDADGYATAIRAAAEDLVARRFLLAEDVDRAVAAADWSSPRHRFELP